MKNLSLFSRSTAILISTRCPPIIRTENRSIGGRQIFAVFHSVSRSSTLLRFLLVSCILLVPVASGCDRRPAFPDVILLTVDTLRADRLGLYGYGRNTTPNLDATFGPGATYLRAYSTEASTSPSVASILTGLLPQEHRVRLFFQLLGPEVLTIPDLLPEAYQTAAVVSNMVLTDEAIGLGARFDHYDDFVDEKEPLREVYERNAARTTDAALAWLAAASDPERPLFLWVHYIDPHGPYHPPSSWQRSFRDSQPHPIDIQQVPDYQREPGVTDGARYMDSYDEEIAYVDAEIGRLLAHYAKRRSLAKSLTIFTADHGESMMEHERWFTHGYHVYEEIVRVPLMVVGPGVRDGTFDRVVSTTDIFPTVLDFAGVRPLPPNTTAVDLRTQVGLSRSRTVYTEATEETGLLLQRRAAIQGSTKWVVEIDARDGSIKDKYLFDLASDPKETVRRTWPSLGEASRGLMDLVRTDPDVGGIPRQFAEGIRISAPKVVPGVDPETLERLKALGYAN
jgi:arylsulfatase A-like enzyme